MKMTIKEASKIARDIVSNAKRQGIISEVASACNVDENIYATMLEGSIKNGLLCGVEKFIQYDYA